MSLYFKFNVLPSLLPDERVLLRKDWVWAASGKSLPSYRWFFSLPPLWEAGLFVTDRRVLFVSYCLRLLTQEFSQWFDGKAGSADDELVVAVDVGRTRLAGPYLEIVSERPRRYWYRSPRARVRIFMKDPERAHQIITQAMGERDAS
jgi:hypothetical protein